MPQNLDHVVGADIEGVGVEGCVEEAVGFGLAADLHVEHPQTDRDVGPSRIGGRGKQERPLGGMILAAVEQPLAERGIKGGRPWIVGQRGHFSRGRAHGIDEQAARGRQPSQAHLRHASFRRRLSGRWPWPPRIARPRY